MKARLKGVFALAALLMLGGCAFTRSVVAIPDSKSTANAAQPVDGPAVKIVEVQDKRVFSIDPKTPNSPSLKDDAIDDPAITSRALGRKRNGFGKALGDFLLPEGDTVANHIRAALADGFRQAGYRVLLSGDPAYDGAMPVKVQILQYWNWMEIDRPVATLSCEAEVLFETSVPALIGTSVIWVDAHGRMLGDPYDDWTKTASNCLEGLSAKLDKTLTASQSGS